MFGTYSATGNLIRSSICVYGLAFAILVALEAAAQAAGKETVLYSFKGGNDGSDPIAGVISDSSGNSYGTTYGGGADGFGTVFKLASDGTETVLHAFKGGSRDGAYPYAGLISDSSGNLYGTTVQGGLKAGICYFGGPIRCGTIFEMAADGTETIRYRFMTKKSRYGHEDDGINPHAALLEDQGGNFYGTTYAGGHGVGTVFELAASGQESVIYAFKGDAWPLAGVIADSAGNLYGTTQNGGTWNCEYACGTVFEIEAGGKEKTFYAFAGGTDGANPVAGLVADAEGNFYGTTEHGGGTGCGGAGCGTVFKLAANGSETVLYSFCAQSNCSDGSTPLAGLLIDNAGNLYGTTNTGGAGNFGTVFEVPAGGAESVLYSFTGGSDGSHPSAGLIFDGAGNLIGTTTAGGANGIGTVFKVKK